MISNTQAITSAAFAQIQRQQAERNAEQAEQRARSLQAAARQANAEADRAQERARTLEVETDQAVNEAGRARSGLAAGQSMQQLSTRLGNMAEQVRDDPPPETTPVEASPAPNPVINTQGQVTGTVINIAV